MFGHLVDWLYMEKIDCTVCEDSVNLSSKEGKENANHVLPWAQLWVLADKLACQNLMSLAEEKFIDCMMNVKFEVSSEVISFVFEQTSQTCFLRKWLPVHFVFLFCQSGSYPDAFGEAAAVSKAFNGEFLKQLRAHLVKKKEDCDIYDCTLHRAGDKSS